MVKKISFTILALAILATGIYAFTRTNYWERSIRIFSYDSNAAFNGREGRGQGGFEGRRMPGESRDFNRSGAREEGFQRPDFRELPDSVRARFEAGRGRPDSDRGNIPDSLRRQSGERNRMAGFRPPFEDGFRDSGGRGRGGFPGGKTINFRNVQWFLAVFAMFTVIAICLDKAVCLIRRKNKTTSCPEDS